MKTTQYKLKTTTIKNKETGEDLYLYEIVKIIPAGKRLWFTIPSYEVGTDFGDENIAFWYDAFNDCVESKRGFRSKEKALNCLNNLNGSLTESV